MSRNGKPKYEKQRKNGLVPVLIAAAVILALAGAAFAVRHTGSQPAPADAGILSGSGQPEETAAPETMPQTDVRLPYALEDGLELTSLFCYTGSNPDCGWSEGTDIGAVILKNDSGRYLEALDLTVITADGGTLSFTVYDIPHGKTVWAFERENKAYDEALEVAEIRCETKFREGNGLVPDKVQAAADGVNVTLTNVSGQTLTGLEVRCHNILDGAYFGGTSYTYPVAEIPAEASTLVFAMDCVLGEAAAVRVDFVN